MNINNLLNSISSLNGRGEREGGLRTITSLNETLLIRLWLKGKYRIARKSSFLFFTLLPFLRECKQGEFLFPQS
jgi:hypothetical protein